MAAAAREAMILVEATRFFAEHGFAGSTRELADVMGVRQALLYKYFADKMAIVEGVLSASFDKEWRAQWSKESATPITERAGAFLLAHADQQQRLRLFFRAVLDLDYFGAPVLKATGFQAFRMKLDA